MDITHVFALVAGAMGKLFGTWLVHFFKWAVLPYFHIQADPHHVSITDEWILDHVGLPVDGDDLIVEWRVTFCLKQKWRSVAGTAKSVCTKGGDDIKGKVISYEVSGSYSNNILDLHLTEVGDSAMRNRSSLMLQLVGDGSVFDGYRVFLGRAKNQVRAIQCKLVRKGACAKCGTA